MAYWIPVNGAKQSNHYLGKTVSIGNDGVINYRVSFLVPYNEPHFYGQFEYLTGYMPRKFSSFWYVDPAGVAQPLSDGPGEQVHPVILSTPSGSHAMGIYSMHKNSYEWRDGGFGRWRHADCVKWNAVWRTRNPQPGTYDFQAFVVVGTLSHVTAMINNLRKTYPQTDKPLGK